MYPRHHPMPPPTPQRSRRTATSTNATTPASSPAVRRGLYAYVGHRVVELLSERQLVDHALSVLPQLRSVAARPHFHGPHWTALRKKHGVELFEFDPADRGAPLAAAGRRSIALPQQQPVARAPLVSTSASASSLATTAAASAASSVHSTGHNQSRHPRQDDPHVSLPRASTLPHGFQTKYKLPNPGIDMAYAAVAQCELEGGVADVVDALFNDDAVEFEASMKALWAGKLKRGDLLLARSVHDHSVTPTYSSSARSTNLDELQGEPGRLAIKTATVGAGLRLTHRQMGAEKLCYTSFTRVSPAGDQAFHVVKTLPLDVHDQIACGKTHVALHDAGVDHIAVGYHLTGIDSVLGGKRTRLVVCAYASSAVSPSSATRASLLHWHPRMNVGGGGIARASTLGAMGLDGVNADARRVVLLLAKAARDFQQIVRQRRFGHQRFVYFPTDRHSSRALEQSCVVCLKRFGLFRKDHYCQLCGHLVCRQCSKKHKVEPLAGKVRENRICFPCVARVDSGTFHDEQLWRSMVRPVVVDADVISPEGHDPILENADDDVDTPAAMYEYQRQYHEHHHDGRARDSTRMSPMELATNEMPPPPPPSPRYDQEDGDPALAFDGSFGSSVGSASSVQREIQVAQDLFSPHPQRRASALEALSRVVLDARLSVEHHNAHYPLRTPTGAATTTTRRSVFTAATPRRTMDPLVVEKYIDDQHGLLGTATSSDRMQAFAVCYPRANPTASHSPAPATSLLESVDQQQNYHYQHHHDAFHQHPLARTSSALKVDTAAFDSICEAVVQRLGYAMVFLVVQRRTGRRQVLGMHLATVMRDRLPRHVDLASYCPSGFATGANLPVVVVEPAHDARFRPFALIHDARIRFFAEFALPGLDAVAARAVAAASLCVMDTGQRGQHFTKQELKTLKTLCAVASDLISAIAH